MILTSCHLASHEPEASIKLHDLGINILLKALLDVHPMRRNDGDFEDVNEGDIEDLVKNYSLYLFRAIRSIFAVERNRKVSLFLELLSLKCLGDKASFSSKTICFVC